MEAALQIVARGEWSKKEIVAMARRTLNMVEKFEQQKRAEMRQYQPPAEVDKEESKG